MLKTFSTLLLCSAFAVSAQCRTVNVKPGDGSLTRAVKNWQPGDTIVLAPGEYRERANFDSSRKPVRDLTMRAAIPGSVVLRGDVEPSKFTYHGNNIWKASYPTCPEVVLERDTLTRYNYAGTVSELEAACGTWTYDADSKTIYLRTTDSKEPAKHNLTFGVTPWHGVSIYATKKNGPSNILFEGFAVTGFYSRMQYPDQRIASSQKKTPWGLVINSPRGNVTVRNVSAMLNGYGIGFCYTSIGGTLDNCRAWGNGNPFGYSGDGVGIFDKNEKCAVINCCGADNTGNDVFLYGGLFAASTKFSGNTAYRSIRVKGPKEPGFKVTNCVATRFSFLDRPRHMENCVATGYVMDGKNMTGKNLIMRFENSLKPDEIFADIDNFDSRPMYGVPQKVASRSAHKPSSTLFFVSAKGNDSANGRSVKTAFSSLARAQKELAKSGRELYIAGDINGSITLKNVRNVIIRGRGKYAAKINGSITLENCSDVKLERLMPGSITVKGGKNITINQSYGKLDVSGTQNLRLTHNYFSSARVNGCQNAFVTANIFGTFSGKNQNGWSDYNAYADKVPANEKYSFKAKPEMGRKGTFKNAWLFDGRAIDAMPVGPFRRQLRDSALKLQKFEFKSITPETAVLVVDTNIPVYGTVYWGDAPDNCKKIINLPYNDSVATLPHNTSCHRVSLTGLKPGKKYYATAKLTSLIPECFSNADVTGMKPQQTLRVGMKSFTAAKEFAAAKEYFVSTKGNDSAEGTAEAPWRSVSFAVNKLMPGDTLTIRGGEYAETVNIGVSGTPDKPITIRGAEGETVRFCAGNGCPLAIGLSIINQSNLIFENLQSIGDVLNNVIGYSSIPVKVENSSNIIFRRMLVGGTAYKILTDNSRKILIEDCAFAFGHEGLTFNNTEVTLRNSTLVFGGVCQIRFRNQGRQKVVLENNIITDMLLMKTMNALVMVDSIDDFTERNNCFFVRLPENERNIYGWNTKDGEPVQRASGETSPRDPYVGRRQVTYERFVSENDRKATSFFANPGLGVLKNFLVTYPDLATWKKKWKKDQKKSWKESSVSREQRMDFKQYLPTDPEVIKRNCGPGEK